MKRSKRTNRRVKILEIKTNNEAVYFDSQVIRAFSNKNRLKHLTDKRKNKRRIRKFLNMKKGLKFTFQHLPISKNP